MKYPVSLTQVFAGAAIAAALFVSGCGARSDMKPLPDTVLDRAEQMVAPHDAPPIDAAHIAYIDSLQALADQLAPDKSIVIVNYDALSLRDASARPERFAAYIKQRTGLDVEPESLRRLLDRHAQSYGITVSGHYHLAGDEGNRVEITIVFPSEKITDPLASQDRILLRDENVIGELAHVPVRQMPEATFVRRVTDYHELAHAIDPFEFDDGLDVFSAKNMAAYKNKRELFACVFSYLMAMSHGDVDDLKAYMDAVTVRNTIMGLYLVSRHDDSQPEYYRAHTYIYDGADHAVLAFIEAQGLIAVREMDEAAIIGFASQISEAHSLSGAADIDALSRLFEARFTVGHGHDDLSVSLRGQVLAALQAQFDLETAGLDADRFLQAMPFDLAGEDSSHQTVSASTDSMRVTRFRP